MSLLSSLEQRHEEAEHRGCSSLIQTLFSFYFPQSSRVEDLFTNYAVTPTNSPWEVILQSGDVFHEKNPIENDRAILKIVISCIHRKRTGIHRQLRNFNYLILDTVFMDLKTF